MTSHEQQGATQPTPPRSTDWGRDGVGMAADGILVIRIPSENDLQQSAAIVTWIDAIRSYHSSKWTIEALERKVAAREADERLKKLLAELWRRAQDADEMGMVSTGPARSLAMGQAQAYVGVLALLKRLFDLEA